MGVHFYCPSSFQITFRLLRARIFVKNVLFCPALWLSYSLETETVTHIELRFESKQYLGILHQYLIHIPNESTLGHSPLSKVGNRNILGENCFCKQGQWLPLHPGLQAVKATCSNIRQMGTPLCFPPFLQRVTTFVSLLPWVTKSFKMGSSLQGKNLLLEEQILSIKSCPQLQRQIKLKLWSSFP